MIITKVDASCTRIHGAAALDCIHVFWVDACPSAGYVTILCYGSAWTAYFGGMGGRTIREFFADCDTGYMVAKMGITPHLKATKRDHDYLARIIDAVKHSLKQGEPA